MVHVSSLHNPRNHIDGNRYMINLELLKKADNCNLTNVLKQSIPKFLNSNQGKNTIMGIIGCECGELRMHVIFTSVVMSHAVSIYRTCYILRNAMM